MDSRLTERTITDSSEVLSRGLERVRLAQDFPVPARSRMELSSVRVTKPHPHWYIRVHPKLELTDFPVMLVEHRKLGYCCVEPPAAAGDPFRLVWAQTNLGLPFLWPIKEPVAKRKPDRWHETAWACARLASTRWVRVAKSRQGYSAIPCTVHLLEPEWPDWSLGAISGTAFAGRIITTTTRPS